MSSSDLCLHEFVYRQQVTPVSYCYCKQCGVVSIIEAKTPNESGIDINTCVKPSYCNSKVSDDPVEMVYQIRKEMMVNYKVLTYTAWYLKIRSDIISYLKILTIRYKLSDSTFFKALYYIDSNFKDKSQCFNFIEYIDYYVSAILFIIAKFNEDNYNEPNLTHVINSHGTSILDGSILLKYEVKCLQILNYNILDYSLYDWISIFFYNGFVFQSEIHNVSISSIYTYTKKIIALITYKVLMLQYSPLVLCLSILKLTRDEFNLSERNFNIILKLYNCAKIDIDACVKSIRTIIILKQKEMKDDNGGVVDKEENCAKKEESPMKGKDMLIKRNSQFNNYASSTKLPRKNMPFLKITNNSSTSNIKEMPKVNVNIRKYLHLKGMNTSKNSNNSSSFIKPNCTNVSYVHLNTQPNQCNNDGSFAKKSSPNGNNKTVAKMNLSKNRNCFLESKWNYLHNEKNSTNMKRRFRKRNFAVNYITHSETGLLTKKDSFSTNQQVYKEGIPKKITLKSIYNRSNLKQNIPMISNQNQTSVPTNLKLKPISTLRTKLPTLYSHTQHA